MRKAKRVIAMALACVSALGCGATIAGCKRDKGEEVDESRTQLYVSSYAGGFGSEWLQSLKTRFEEAYAEESYESGKKGVQVLIDDGESSGASIALSANSNEVIFTESVPYYNWVKSKSIVDISDVVADVIAQDGVDLNESQKSALTVLDGKYYALPHYEGYYGVVYDKDLFDSKSLYFAATGGFTNAAGTRTVGPDGTANTDDDGLPATWEEFFTLCQYMKVYRNVTPFILSGDCANSYSMRLLDRICAAYTGEKMETWYTFNGENIPYVESITDNDNALFGYTMNVQTTTISNENGYLLRQLPGRITALSVVEKLIDDGYFYADALSATETNTVAQEDYINSTPKNKPIAMLIEGSWWENEADEAFNRSINYYPSYYPNKLKSDRNFGYMPLPTKINATDTNVGDSGLSLDYTRAYAIINKSATEDWKLDLAKDFLRFAYSAESLEKYTQETGTARGVQYEISQTTYDGLSAFGKDLWNNHKNGKILYKLSDNLMYVDNEADFTDTWKTSAGGGYASPFGCFRGGELNTKSYYNGTLIASSTWSSNYSDYFD